MDLQMAAVHSWFLLVQSSCENIFANSLLCILHSTLGFSWRTAALPTSLPTFCIALLASLGAPAATAPAPAPALHSWLLLGHHPLLPIRYRFLRRRLHHGSHTVQMLLVMKVIMRMLMRMLMLMVLMMMSTLMPRSFNIPLPHAPAKSTPRSHTATLAYLTQERLVGMHLN